jgi:hypothetical protein
MTQKQRQQAIAGIAMILLGLGLFYMQDLGNSVVFFLVGGGFLVGYLYRRESGFLIPACIILSLGVANLGRWIDHDISRMLVLGLGFVSFTVVTLVYERRFTWWPLIPGGSLVLLGLPRSRELTSVVLDNWQLLLVAAGVLVFIGAFFRPGSRPKAPGRD